MEEVLKVIINDYIEEVNVVCNILINELNLKSKFDFWDYRSINNVMEIELNGIKYNFHGRGCCAIKEDKFIDWDFGYGSRWCGIQPWLLARTLQTNKNSHVEYYDGNKIIDECERAVAKGEMYKKHDLYYFTIQINDTFEPEFPTEFDTLVIEYYNLKVEVSRTKLVDRFIRKSKRVYKNVGMNGNTYTLSFRTNGCEVYSILYDDISYPSKAVTIMAEILKNTTLQ